RLLAAKIPAIPSTDDASACTTPAAIVAGQFHKARRQGSIPRPVSYEEAAFGTVGAICLHGIRTAEVSLGDTVAVIGLGLLGQITVQLLKAAGCRVLGMDPIRERTDLAIRGGATAVTTSSHDFRDLCFQMTGGKGADAVVITAETPSSDPVNLAAEAARDRAIVCAVGTVGMELERKLYFEKELIFRVSRYYGPGRYDAAYEQKGRDYPIGYVRWTETRNMEVFLRFIAEGKLDLSSLITHRFPIEQAQQAYDLVTGRAEESSLGILLTYPDADRDASEPSFDEASFDEASFDKTVLCRTDATVPTKSSVAVGVLGAGNFAQAVLLPALKAIPEVSFVGVRNASGARSRKAAEKFRFSYSARSAHEILGDPKVNTVVISTPHNLHAPHTLAAIAAGKNVFCEKPLCLTEDELAAIVRALSLRSFAQHHPKLMVGFNRRFAPMALALKKFVSEIHEPLSIHYRINAGFISADHWINDPEQGGGRILGEMCHFVDFLCFLTGAYPTEVRAESVGNAGQY
ncbi:MAG: bi-domain-containing oxidoreductase, partial [Mycobacterium sp.]